MTSDKKMNPAVIAAVIGAGTALAQGIARGGPKRQYKWNKKAAEDANRINRENQQWIMQQERALQEEQRRYDSPEAQMKRYLEAGLNPNMIYGSGSSAGQAFPIHAAGVPGVNINAPQASYPDIGGSFMAGMQQYAQTGLIQAKTDESLFKQALISVQTDIAKSNPMLDPSVAMWVSTSMQESARLKTLESRSWMTYESPDYLKVTARVNAELDAAMQRVGLNTTDLAIKNKILESKEFENVVKELQAKWMKDAEVTPQHFYQALLLILGKMM